MGVDWEHERLSERCFWGQRDVGDYYISRETWRDRWEFATCVIGKTLARVPAAQPRGLGAGAQDCKSSIPITEKTGPKRWAQGTNFLALWEEKALILDRFGAFWLYSEPSGRCFWPFPASGGTSEVHSGPSQGPPGRAFDSSEPPRPDPFGRILGGLLPEKP